MGSLEGMQGAWSYVQGGMGALSDAIASSATAHGASIFTEKTVAKVQVNSEGRVQGVVLQGGEEVRSRVVLSCASPQVTFLELTPQDTERATPSQDSGSNADEDIAQSKLGGSGKLSQRKYGAGSEGRRGCLQTEVEGLV